MNLYVIGSVSGIEKDNRPEFERVRGELKATGKHPIVLIPHDVVPEGCEWHIARSLCIKRMMELWNESLNNISRGQDFGIAKLDDWETSSGAIAEFMIALMLDIPCKPWRDWL